LDSAHVETSPASQANAVLSNPDNYVLIHTELQLGFRPITQALQLTVAGRLSSWRSMAGPCPPSWVVDPRAAGAQELAPGVWRLRLPWTWDGVDHVNAYLLTDGEEHVLVDCGPGGDPSCGAAFERALAATGVPASAIGRVMLTHAHSDHVGQLRAVVERSGAEVWRHPASEHVDAIIREPERSAARRMGRARAEGVPRGELDWFGDVREEVEGIGEPLPRACALEDGGVVPSPLGPLHVLATPGHAPSHVALVQPERGIAILGDTVCAVFAPYYDYGFSRDPVGEMLASLQRLAEIGPVALALPGHGRPLADLPAVLVRDREGIGRSLSAVRGAVGAGPAGAYEIGRRAFGRATSAFSTFARTNLAAGYLRHLRVRGEVVRVSEPDERFHYHPAGARA
jgi:glyoxylase-like metal-dependent hydrolase (beta-lactamase superfamily II)